MRFLFFYLMHDEPERVTAVAPRHAQYWQELALPGYLDGGPDAGVASYRRRQLFIVDGLPAAAGCLHEVEGASCDEDAVVREVDQMNERLTVDLERGHPPIMPSIAIGSCRRRDGSRS